MPAIRRVSISQLEILLDFAEENKDIVLGRYLRGPHSTLVTQRAWAALAPKLNDVPQGVTKTGYQWRRYWIEWKFKTKVKAATLKRNASQTGGRVKRLTPLTDLEVRILQIIGRKCLEGLPGVQIPFNAPSSSSQPTDNRSLSYSSTPEREIKCLEDDIDPLTLSYQPSPTLSPIPSTNIISQGFQQSQQVPRQHRSHKQSSPVHPAQPLTQQHPRHPVVPERALSLEERRMAIEERHVRALESLTDTLERRLASIDQRLQDIFNKLDN